LDGFEADRVTSDSPESKLPPDLVAAIDRFLEIADKDDSSKTIEAWRFVVQTAPMNLRRRLARAAYEQGIFPPPDGYDEEGNPARSIQTMADFWGVSEIETLAIVQALAEEFGGKTGAAIGKIHRVQ
jgi:hypothetical protein